MTPMYFPAYIGPGAGYAFLGGFLTLALSVLAALGSLLLWPARLLRSLLRRRKGSVRRAIFLGFDGLDPNITERAPTFCTLVALPAV